MNNLHASPKIYTIPELQQAAEMLEKLIDDCESGKIDQHLSPTLNIAVDCIRETIQSFDWKLAHYDKDELLDLGDGMMVHAALFSEIEKRL